MDTKPSAPLNAILWSSLIETEKGLQNCLLLAI